MTNWELHILKTFADRYAASSAAQGGKKLRLRRNTLFPAFDDAKPDDRESFLDACESLENAGILTLSWERHRIGERLEAALLTDSDALYASIGQRAPDDECARARTEALHPAHPNGFLIWLSENLTPLDVENGMDAKTVKALAHLINVVENHEASGIVLATPARALSVSLFSDSKEIERLLAVSGRIFRRAENAGIPIPDLDFLKRHFPETLVAGRIVFRLTDQGILDNSCGLILGIPLESAKRISYATPSRNRVNSDSPPRILGVENKETFHALAGRLASGALEEYDALIYVGGHVNPAVALVFSAFARSGFALHHSGDLDPDGILILQELVTATGHPVLPVHMDAVTFDQYFRHGRKLETTMLARISLINDETRMLPGIDGLLNRILATARGIEQENLPFD